MKDSLKHRGTSDELRELRTRALLTVSEACRLAGVPRSTWEKWEQDSDSPHYNPPPQLVFSWLKLYIDNTRDYPPDDEYFNMIEMEDSLEKEQEKVLSLMRDGSLTIDFVADKEVARLASSIEVSLRKLLLQLNKLKKLRRQLEGGNERTSRGRGSK